MFCLTCDKNIDKDGDDVTFLEREFHNLAPMYLIENCPYCLVFAEGKERSPLLSHV